MSCQESVYYGYGFSVEHLTNIDLVKEILINSFKDEELKKMVKETKAENMYDLFEDIEVEHLMSEAISMFIADWMTNNKKINPKGIQFEGYASDGECDTEETVMFPILYPWLYTPEERNLTKDELHEILCNFAKLLGVKLEEIDYKELHYYG